MGREKIKKGADADPDVLKTSGEHEEPSQVVEKGPDVDPDLLKTSGEHEEPSQVVEKGSDADPDVLKRSGENEEPSQVVEKGPDVDPDLVKTSGEHEEPSQVVEKGQNADPDLLKSSGVDEEPSQVVEKGSDADPDLKSSGADEEPSQVVEKGEDARAAVIPRDVVFMYPPVGAQKVNMGRALFEGERVYQEAILDCSRVAAAFLPMALVEVLYPEAASSEIARSMIDQAWFTQPCMFAVGYALTKLFESHQVFPTAVIGHSIGEYAAAVAAGIMNMPTAMSIVCKRALLMHQLPVMGAMFSVHVSRKICETALLQVAKEDGAADTIPEVAVAAVNGSDTTVISGGWAALKKVISALPPGTKPTKVNASHPDHSPLNERIHEGLHTECQTLFATSPPSAPAKAVVMVSTVTGGAVDAGATSAQDWVQHWVRHTTSPVLFTDGFAALLELSNKAETQDLTPIHGGHHPRLFVDMGAGMMMRMARAVCSEDDLERRGIALDACLSMEPNGSDMNQFNRCLQAVQNRSEVASGPAAQDLSKKEVDKPPKPEPVVSPKEVLLSVLRDLGAEVDENDLAKGFSDYGITSSQAVRILDSLKNKLHIDIQQTAIWDYPSVQTLSSFLERELTSQLPTQKIQSPRAPPSVKISEACEEPDPAQIRLKSLLAINTEFVTAFGEGNWQERFAQFRKETYPERDKYLETMTPSVEEKMRQIVKELDRTPLIHDLGHVNELIIQYWPSSIELQEKVKQLRCVLMQDAALWPKIADSRAANGDQLEKKVEPDNMVEAFIRMLLEWKDGSASMHWVQNTTLWDAAQDSRDRNFSRVLSRLAAEKFGHAESRVLDKMLFDRTFDGLADTHSAPERRLEGTARQSEQLDQENPTKECSNSNVPGMSLRTDRFRSGQRQKDTNINYNRPALNGSGRGDTWRNMSSLTSFRASTYSKQSQMKLSGESLSISCATAAAEDSENSE